VLTYPQDSSEALFRII